MKQRVSLSGRREASRKRLYRRLWTDEAPFESVGALRVEPRVEDRAEAEEAVEEVLLSLPEDLAEEETDGAPPFVVPDLELRVSETDGVFSVLVFRERMKFLLKLLEEESLLC